MIEWLESYLSQRDLTLFLVTHDRYFLDRVCDSIIELEDAKLFHYKGNYQYFIESKAARELATLSELNKDKNTYRRELEWVRKMPKARGTKSKSRVESFNHLEDKIRSHRNSLEVKMNMRMDRLGTKILEFHSVNKNYGDKVILDNFSYIFKRKEKVGIIGINGVGKSTMMNLIVGLEDIDSGKIVTGETIKFGYYSQKGIKVDDSKKVIDVVREIADWIPLDDGAKLTASQLLLKFGFSYEKQFDFVTKLSGGEKRRLYLMTVLMAAPNFLILDEPTNDLDIQTLTVLEDFLDSYDGCVIVVSHDRFFMDKVVDHCFIFEGNGIIRDFPGNYTEYRELVTLEESLNEVSKKEPIVKVNIEHSNQVDQQESKQKLSFKDKFELDKINSELPQKLKLKNEILQEMSGSSLNFEELSKMAKSLEELQTEIDAMEIRWLELSI
jgi:ATP-binding cassette subfamily F protein uup